MKSESGAGDCVLDPMEREPGLWIPPELVDPVSDPFRNVNGEPAKSLLSLGCFGLSAFRREKGELKWPNFFSFPNVPSFEGDVKKRATGDFGALDSTVMFLRCDVPGE